MAFNNILFDLDGTLTNPYEGISKCIKYALEQFGIFEDDEEKLKSFIGPPLINTFMIQYGFDKDDAKKASERYRERYSKIGLFENKLIEDVPETLYKLKSSGKKLFLATSKPEPYAIRILEYFKIDKYFDFIGGADLNYGRDDKWKVIEYVFEHENIAERSSSIMVGDRKHDIIGAKKCNIKTLGVLCGFGSREELIESGADFVVEKFSDIVDIILE